MSTESQNIQELFNSWILDAETKLEENDLAKNMKNYLLSQHSEICGKCAPCRDGVIKMEKLLDKYLDGTATLKTLKELEQITYNLRASRCSVGLDIGKNFEVILENSYHVLYQPVKKY
jgi:NADH:ubiquinone oxidoreductase subunit F (NADH-binding)